RIGPIFDGIMCLKLGRSGHKYPPTFHADTISITFFVPKEIYKPFRSFSSDKKDMSGIWGNIVSMTVKCDWITLEK
ncbi:MAG TPA: hypothetical protein PLN56_09040, partial [Methanoregulaceae archaeon]|nr:hypothetical protein [Methanoregulaceae archaeon]HPD11122.1 hypothetical protein [Methanoregulaceae archaeon]HRT16172.1 hypothetical protein [Methanoregulaceae archaeon]HRU31709.1 hypothetical protein [Methanoregulaceae archaeon]